MQIVFDIDLSATDQDALAAALGCTTAQLPQRLPGHARAALGEYVEAYVGRRAFSRGSDILEHRLALLIEHAFDNKIPRESDVARLFQSTLTSTRSLLRTTLSKYRFQLKDATSGSAKTALDAAVWNAEDQRFRIELKASNLFDVLNQRLAAADGKKEPIVRVPESSTIYSVRPATYALLCQEFGAIAVAQG